MTIKKIHRIYFGFDGKPDPYQHYMRGWERLLPDYEIVHWDTTNLPMDSCEFARIAYAARDHAFLSDYFRWWVLREHGGIYLDADIEIINGIKFNEIIEELENRSDLQAAIGVDNRQGGWYTGHSVASKKASDYSQFMCKVYEDFGAISIWRRKIFYFMSPQLSALYFAQSGHNVDGMGTSPWLDQPVVINQVKIYPQEYFSPMTPAQRRGVSSFVIDAFTANTVLCHHFSCSWHDKDSPYLAAKGNGHKHMFLRDLVRDGRFLSTSLATMRVEAGNSIKRMTRKVFERILTGRSPTR